MRPALAQRRRGALAGLVAFGTLGALLLPNSATSATLTTPHCPPIANKPHQVPHVHYDGIQHLTYCYGPISIQPGQNFIRLNATNLFPTIPGYITRFDPELVYPSGRVPRVDMLHLHHAVWVVNGNPQFAVGEEKTISQLPRGFGWRSLPTDTWLINDMLHDLTPEPATVYVVWRIDFVPLTAPSAASIHPVHTQWMSVAGPDQQVGISSRIYPVFNALRGMGQNGRYTFPGNFHVAGQAGDDDDVFDAIEEFVTGAPAVHDDDIDRILTTVLFTDIVDSTGRASQLGDRGGVRDVREEVAGHG